MKTSDCANSSGRGRIEALEARIAPAYTAAFVTIGAEINVTFTDDASAFVSNELVLDLDPSGFLRHNRDGAPTEAFDSPIDLNTAVAGTQSAHISQIVAVTVNAGAGQDHITIAGALTLNDIVAPDFILNGGDADDVISGSGGEDTLDGGLGNDVLYGLAGNDTLIGGDNNDRIYVGSGNNTVTDGPGDDLIDFSDNSSAITFTIAAGNDTVIGTPFDDVITGGPGNDRIEGRGGRDSLAGGPGTDVFFGGDEADTITWNPGDGSDVIEGGPGQDSVNFNGSAAAEIISVNANGGRAAVIRNVGNINLDVGGVETVNINGGTAGGGGADVFNIGDLSGTELQLINLNLVAGGDADLVVVDGTSGNDVISLSSEGTIVEVTGLPATVRIQNGNNTDDQLTLQGNDGDDILVLNAGVQAQLDLTLSGDAGDDILDTSASVSGSGALILNGLAGEDTLIGGAADERMDGGGGDDRFVGNGGTDAIGAGISGSPVGDTILVPGTSGDDTVLLSLNGAGHLQVTINGVTTTYTNFLGGAIATSGIDTILAEGGGGNDVLTIDSLNGAVPISLTYDGGSGDDSLALMGGTASSDIYAPGPNRGEGSSTIVINGNAQTLRFSDLEATLDLVAGPLTVRGTAADNAIHYSQTPGDPTRGRVTVDDLPLIDFSNKSVLRIEAGAGHDVVSRNNQSTPTGLTRIIVDLGPGQVSDPSFPSGRAFSAPSTYDVGRNPLSVAVGDLNGDGVADIVTVNASTLTLLFSNDGIFPDSTTIDSGGRGAVAVALGDVDGDTDLDIVVSHKKSNEVITHLNDGTGTFALGNSLDAVKPRGLEVGDLGNDGDLDIIALTGGNTASVFTNIGVGVFDPAVTVDTGGLRPIDLAVGDFNNDNLADLLVLHGRSADLGLLTANATGFDAPVTFATGSGATALAVADFNNDGALDAAVLRAQKRLVHLLLGNGAATPQFDSPLSIRLSAVVAPQAFVANDLDGDGITDLAFAGQPKGSLIALLGLGNGAFKTPATFGAGALPPGPIPALAFGDFNDDGHLDAVLVHQRTSQISVLLRTPPA